MPTDEELGALKDLTTGLRASVARVVVGQDAVVEALLIALLAQGHVLLEGPPGTAKTLLARTFSRCLGLQFRPHPVHSGPDARRRRGYQPLRLPDEPVQPDQGPHLHRLPARRRDQPDTAKDAVGVAPGDAGTRGHDRRGDASAARGLPGRRDPEPHRARGYLPPAPKPNSTGSSSRSRCPTPAATRNARSSSCTATGPRCLRSTTSDWSPPPIPRCCGRRGRPSGRCTSPTRWWTTSSTSFGQPRDHAAVLHGASPRAANMLATAARTRAALHGRAFGIPDDVKALVPAVLRHRLVLTPAAEVDRTTVPQVLSQILESVPAPR